MAGIFYKDLLDSINREGVQIENEISTKAEKICNRRQRYAVHLEQKLTDIKKERDSAVAVLNDMISAVSTLNCDEKDSIKSHCETIMNELDKYVQNVTNLCVRFKNQKIRIVSFGPKTQGKSKFTQLYTNLPDAVVAVKPDGNGIDKTGAINVIKHNTAAQSIIVHFKTEEKVVEQINSFISLLPTELNIIPCKDFKEVLDTKNNNTLLPKLKNPGVSILASAKAGLESFFGDDKNIEEAGKGTKSIGVDEIPIYNDMQYKGEKGQRYAVVDYIEINTNLGRDFFKYFEIGDTKGASIDAGGEIADLEIFNAIDTSDAAFSITRVGPGQNGGEYITTTLYNHYADKQEIDYLQDKLFVILNVDRNSLDKGEIAISTVVGDIETQRMADSIYVGCLLERPVAWNYDINKVANLEKMNPSLFVNAVLYDMLKKIVNNTKKNDDSIIAKVNASATNINEEISKLRSLTSGITSLKEESVDCLLLEQIIKLRDDTYNIINKQNGTANVDDNQHANVHHRHRTVRGGGFNYGQEQQTECENGGNNTNSYTVEQPSEIDYENLYIQKRSRECSIFSILTGENRSIQGKENQTVRQEIEDAVKHIYKLNRSERPKVYDFITDESKKPLKGDTSDSGRYIECVSKLLCGRIRDNFNKPLTPQNEIDYKSEADNLFRLLWDGLRLKDFQDWGSYSSENFAEKSVLCQQLKELWKLYSSAYDRATPPVSIFTSFDTLKEYFRRFLQSNNENKQFEETDVVINDDILISTLIDLICERNLPRMIVDKMTEKDKIVSDLRTKILQEISPNSDFANNMLPLYRLPEASPVFSAELQERRELNDKIRKFNSSKEAVNALNNVIQLSIPV